MLLGEASYTHERDTVSIGSDGREQVDSTATATITASIQPVRGQWLDRLPEGEGSENYRVVYTTTALALGDRVDGLKVLEVQDWPSFSPIPHYAALVRGLRDA